MKKMRPVSTEGAEIIGDFIGSLQGRNLSPRTLQEYGADLKHFVGWHEYRGMDSCINYSVFSFDSISTEELESYLQAMKDAQLKAATINRRLSTIKLFFDWAYHGGQSHRNPAKHVKLVHFRKVPTRIISEEEEKRLLDAVRAHGTLRDQAILKLMILSGLHAAEICTATPQDIKITGKSHEIRFFRGNHELQIPLNPICRSILQRYLPTLQEGSPYLFSSEKTQDRLTERAIRYIIKKYLDIAGLDGLSAFSFRNRSGRFQV